MIPAYESGLRLIRQITEVRTLGVNIRRIGKNQIKLRSVRRKRLVPAPLKEPDTGLPGVPARHFKRRLRPSARPDLRLWILKRHSDRDAAATSPHIKDRRTPEALQLFKRELHDELGVRSRNENVRRHAEASAIKLLLARDIGVGFTGKAPRGVAPEGRFGLWRHLFLRMRHESLHPYMHGQREKQSGLKDPDRFPCFPKQFLNPSHRAVSLRTCVRRAPRAAQPDAP